MRDDKQSHGRPRQVYRAAPAQSTRQRPGAARPPKAPQEKTTGNPGKKSPKNPPKNLGEFWRRHQRNILVAGAILLLVVILLLVMLIPSCAAVEGSVSLATSLTSGVSSTIEDDIEDVKKIILAGDEYPETILQETEDAGQEYVDDTLFLGDSNTVRMLNYRDATGVSTQNAIGVVGMGIQSVTGYKCVKYEGYSSLVTMPEAVAITQPRRVVITFGTNNVGGMGVDSFIGHYESAVEAIRESYEYADVIIGAVFPVDANCSATGITLAKIEAYNAALAELADRLECKFLYWSEALRDTATGYAVSDYTIRDGYHISRDGMEALFDYFRTHSYITEDKRPTLKPVPNRLNADVDLITNDGNTKTVPGQVTSMPAIATTSVAPSTSSEVAQAASVIYSVWDATNFVTGGGTVNVGGGSHSSYTWEGYAGDIVPTATAVAAEGYRFMYWSTAASIDTGSASAGGFAAGAGTVTLTAVFEKIEVVVSVPEPDPPAVEPSVPEAPQPEPEPTPSEAPPAEPGGGEEMAGEPGTQQAGPTSG